MQAARLKLWLSRSDCPPAVNECQQIFWKWYGSPITDDDPWPETQFSEDDTGHEMPQVSHEIQAPEELRYLFSPKIKLHARYKHDGIIFARSSTHRGNSLIEFYAGGDISKSPIPGSIVYICDVRRQNCVCSPTTSLGPSGHQGSLQVLPQFPCKGVFSTLVQ
jgi:hypothetical protein